jgi:hypothetical protein
MDNGAESPLISNIIMNPLHFLLRRCLPTAALLAIASTAPALEPRTWITLDGRTIDAELIKTEGDIVELKDKTGTVLKVSRLSLSFGDHDYIAEYAPEEKKNAFAKPAGKVKLPNPAKEMKFVGKSVKKDTGELKLGGATFRVAESTRFKIYYSKGVDPADTAELAERLWHDTAFFHSSFAAKFKDRRMAIIMAEGESDFAALGEWYVEMLNAAGNTKGAKELAADWSKVGATTISLPAETAETNGVLTQATLIRVLARGAKQDAIGDNGKGVWASFRTHVLAGHLMELQAGGGVSGFAKEGQFALFTGHSYHKEIDLTGATTTGIFNKDTSKNATASGGYDGGKNWSSELKSRIRKKDVKPSLTTLFASSIDDAKADDLALAYSFSRFLQSTPERHTSYGKLLERISTSHQVPDLDSIAKMYNLADGAALEKAWLEFVSSGDFK